MKNANYILLILLCLVVIYPTLESSSKPKYENKFPKYQGQFADGDIIFRQGKGWISDMFKNISSKDKKFSHAGVVMIENGEPFVYHVIRAEGEEKGGLKKQSVADFCNSNYNNIFAVYRASFLSGKQIALTSYFNKLTSQGIVFDDHFDMATDKELYCTEMIYKMIHDVSGHSLLLSTFNGQEYVTPDNIYLESGFKKLIEFKYNPD